MMVGKSRREKKTQKQFNKRGPIQRQYKHKCKLSTI